MLFMLCVVFVTGGGGRGVGVASGCQPNGALCLATRAGHICGRMTINLFYLATSILYINHHRLCSFVLLLHSPRMVLVMGSLSSL